MGQRIYDVNSIFTVPEGITELTVCMCGGGGSGAAGASISQSPECGGGYAGEVKTGTLTVTPLEDIDILIGAGGAAVNEPYGLASGNPGQQTQMDSLIAAGGNPGIPNSVFLGNGQAVTTCLGTGSNGSLSSDDYMDAYGGQSSGAGNGGAGDANYGGDAHGGTGGVGSGGGAGMSDGSDEGSGTSGAGGSGRVVVSWDDAPSGKPEFRMNGDIIPEDTGLVRFYDPTLDPIDYPDGYVNIKSVMEDGQVVWIETHDLPEKIGDFNATDDEVGQVTMTWTDLVYSGHVTYNLYSGTTELMGNITQPYVYTVAAGTADYHIRAVNIIGGTDSDIQSGTSL